MSANLTLSNSRGNIYLNRRGFECRWFGIYLHRIESPDPGFDLHDHPWWFGSLVLSGGYDERRSTTRGGISELTERRRFSWRTMRLDECHRIVYTQPNTRTLVIRGPHVRKWGFLTRRGWVPSDQLPASSRDLLEAVL